MSRYHVSREFPYPADFVYATVADVARYPSFLPWCKELDILQQAGNQLDAKMTIEKGPVSYTFQTQVSLLPKESIDIVSVGDNDSLKKLVSAWRFSSSKDSPGHCMVDFSIEVELEGFLTNLVLGNIFESLGQEMIEAFEKRVLTLHMEKVDKK